MCVCYRYVWNACSNQLLIGPVLIFVIFPVNLLTILLKFYLHVISIHLTCNYLLVTCNYGAWAGLLNATFMCP